MANTDWENAWKSENLGSTFGGLSSGISGVISAGAKNAQIDDTTDIENQIAETRNEQFDYNDYDSLASAFSTTDLAKTNIRGSSLIQPFGKQILNTIEGTISGAVSGAQVGAVPGAIVGSVAGLLSGIGGGIVGKIKADKRAAKLNAAGEEANRRYLANFSNNAESISQRNFNTALLNLAAYGGALKDTNIDNFTKSKIRLAAFGGDLNTPYDNRDFFTNGVIKVENGGSHETNPFGGVLMGVDPNGTPNLVEQGEVIFNDYVFSNRLAPTEKQLEEVKLPTKYAGKPFSYIAEKIQEESEMRPLDSISRNTLIDSMSKLTTIQEEQRQRDLEYQDMAEAEDIFAGGGSISIDPSKRGTFTAAAKRRGMGVQEFASKVLANKEKYSPAMVRKANFARNAKSFKHALGGNLFPYGGYEWKFNEDTGRMEMMPIEDNTTEEYVIVDGEPVLKQDAEQQAIQDANNAQIARARVANNETYPETPWWQSAMRFAPVVGSSIQTLADSFGWDNKEDYTNPNIINRARNSMRNVSSRPLGNRLTYRPFDLDYEQNRLQNVALGTQRGMLDTAMGNAGAARNAMLALNANTQNQMGDLFRKAQEYNQAQRASVEQFNAGIDQFNAQQGLQADIYNQRRDEANAELAVREAMLRDSIESTLSGVRSNNRTQLYNNLGNFGQDRTYADMARWYQQYIAPWNQATRAYTTTGAAKGGKIIREFKRKK